MQNNKSQIVIYKTEDGQTKIDVRFDGETVWLTQNVLAELFQTTKQNISQHIKNIFDESELQPNSVVKDFLTTAADGKNYAVNYYNLDLIISVGYRVKSSIATAFRLLFSLNSAMLAILDTPFTGSTTGIFNSSSLKINL